MKCAKPRRMNQGGAWGVLAILGTIACQAGTPRGHVAAQAPSNPARATTQPSAHASAGATPEEEGAASRTAAPEPAPAPDPQLAGLLASCGEGDGALHRAAAKLLTQDLLRHPLDNASLTFAIRSSGGPYVKPRGLRLHQEAGTDPAAFADALRQWASTLGLSSARRCGIAASVQVQSGYWLSVVVAEALANLEPLPTRVAPGARLEFRAQLLVPATRAALLVLGPDGPPREFLPALAGDRVEANFFLDTPGLHQIQLVVDEAGGPAAAAEAWVGVGGALPAIVEGAAAPGEQVPVDPSKPEATLLAMVNAARTSEGLPPLTADPLLTELAERHAVAMLTSERLEHDLGDGNPRWRLEAEGVHAATTGENLARASSLTRAHRATWASASHRANLLNPYFDKIGIGAARSASGEWWVCELLADLR